MRMGVNVGMAGAAGGIDARIIDVRSPVWREYWLRWEQAAGVYTLDVYRSEADMAAQINRLGSADHAASVGSSALVVPIVPDVGAPLDVDPMEVHVHAQGAWDVAQVAWTHRLTTLLLRRIRDVLTIYREPGEVLAPPITRGVGFGHQPPSAQLPLVGVSSGTVTVQPQVPGATLEQHEVQFELWGWASNVSNDTAYLEAADLGSALITICEEQRTWGGLVADTRILPPSQITIERDGTVYQALVVGVSSFSDLVASRTTTSNPGDGGPYPSRL